MGDGSAALAPGSGMFYGQAIEKPETFVLFKPWESVEVSLVGRGEVVLHSQIQLSPGSRGGYYGVTAASGFSPSRLAGWKCRR